MSGAQMRLPGAPTQLCRCNSRRSRRRGRRSARRRCGRRGRQCCRAGSGRRSIRRRACRDSRRPRSFCPTDAAQRPGRVGVAAFACAAVGLLSCRPRRRARQWLHHHRSGHVGAAADARRSQLAGARAAVVRSRRTVRAQGGSRGPTRSATLRRASDRIARSSSPCRSCRSRAQGGSRGAAGKFRCRPDRRCTGRCSSRSASCRFRPRRGSRRGARRPTGRLRVVSLQTLPQQSAPVAQASPAGRQPGIAGAQFPMVHAPPQQSAAVAQLSAAGWQSGITGAQHPSAVAVAAIGGDRAWAAGGGARRSAAERRSCSRAHNSLPRARTAARSEEQPMGGRDRPSGRRRWEGAAQERAAVGGQRAGGPFRQAGGSAAQLPGDAASGAAVGGRRAGGAVRGAVAGERGRGVVSSTSFRQPSEQRGATAPASARPPRRDGVERERGLRLEGELGQPARGRCADPARELAEVAARERARASGIAGRLRGLHRADERLLAQGAARGGVERALVVGARGTVVSAPPFDLRGGVKRVLAHRRWRAPPIERVVGGDRLVEPPRLIERLGAEIAQLVLAGVELVAAAACLELGGRPRHARRGFEARGRDRPRACWRGRRPSTRGRRASRRRRSARVPPVPRVESPARAAALRWREPEASQGRLVRGGALTGGDEARPPVDEPNEHPSFVHADGRSLGPLHHRKSRSSDLDARVLRHDGEGLACEAMRDRRRQRAVFEPDRHGGSGPRERDMRRSGEVNHRSARHCQIGLAAGTRAPAWRPTGTVAAGPTARASTGHRAGQSRHSGESVSRGTAWMPRAKPERGGRGGAGQAERGRRPDPAPAAARRDDRGRASCRSISICIRRVAIAAGGSAPARAAPA